MLLKEILRLRRDSGGAVPLEILRSLGLPMPENVLEQFVHDHGTKEEFQEQYGHIDLHAVYWELAELPAYEIVEASILPRYERLVDDVAEEIQVVVREGWDATRLSPALRQQWRDHGTWRRSPVTLVRNLTGSESRLHLVEGHNRMGTLRGLLACDMLSLSSIHRIWVGGLCPPVEAAADWREILREERMPFRQWLMDHVGEKSEIGTIGSRLIDIEDRNRHFGAASGDDLQSVLEVAAKDRMLAPLLGTIERAHAEWEQVMGA